jgi:hypothetical protein
LGIGGMEDRQQYVGHSYAVGCELYFAAYCIHMLQKCWGDPDESSAHHHKNG